MLHATPRPKSAPLLKSSDDAGGKEFGDLPEWDLSDLYKGEDDPQLHNDLAWLETECADFARDYEGKLATLEATGFLTAIKRDEKLSNIIGRIMSFAGLRYYQLTVDSGRAKFMSDCQEKITLATRPLVFFALELNALEDSVLRGWMDQSPELARYKTYFDRIRAMKPYQLSDELEQFLHDLGAVDDAWERLFDETIAGLRFDIEGEEYNIEAALNFLTDKDRAKRQTAAEAVAKTIGENAKLFARVHNTQTKTKSIIDEWRKMPTPQTGRHLSNHVEPEIVEALRNAVVAAYPDLSHRYYKLKAKWMGLDKLQVWDRNAPLPMESEKTVMWDEARSIVQNAYCDFDPRLVPITDPFFDKGWIDAAVKPGKAQGAFSHGTVSNVHPYVMLNYMGKPRDVMTLAHELGHAIHQTLAADLGDLLASTPLTLAETASVFGEMLTFRKMLNGAKDLRERQVLLAGKVEDMINTVVRQIAFYDFECKLHEARTKGELTVEDINAIWMSVQGESLGPIFEFMDGYETFWAYIPHFVHSPFYVYAYAFGDGLVNALYAAFEEKPEGFVEKYFDLLKAGGSKHHSELLAMFDLDASDPAFWQKGLGMISGMIDELEEIDRQLT